MVDVCEATDPERDSHNNIPNRIMIGTNTIFETNGFTQKIGIFLPAHEPFVSEIFEN